MNGNDYNIYRFNRAEFLKHCLFGCVYFIAMGMIFFNHIVLAVLSCGLVVFYIKERKHDAIKKRKEILREQFKEGMYALSSALSAGRSVEQAFVQSLEDLKLLYKEDTDIIIEWQSICYKLRMNETIESALSDFALRSDIEDIDNFTSVFVMAKRSGGNLIEIIGETSKLINEKIDIQKRNRCVDYPEAIRTENSFLHHTRDDCFFWSCVTRFSRTPLYNRSWKRDYGHCFDNVHSWWKDWQEDCHD